MGRKVFASYLIPLITGMILIDFLGGGFLNQLFFMVACFWPFTMLYPGLNEKVMSRKYRFSTMRLFFWYNSLFAGFVKKESPYGLKILFRGLPPVTLLLLAHLTSGAGNLLFVFGGFFLFELCHYFVHKIFKGTFLIPHQLYRQDFEQMEMENILNPKEWEKSVASKPDRDGD